MRMKYEPIDEQVEGDLAIGNIDPLTGGDNDGNDCGQDSRDKLTYNTLWAV